MASVTDQGVEFDNQEMSDFARGWYPEIEGRIALGNPGKYGYRDPGVYTIENTKSQQELGIRCKSSRRVGHGVGGRKRDGRGYS